MNLGKILALFVLVIASHKGMATPTESHRIKTIEIKSTIAAQQLNFKVILPQGYDTQSEKKYPVLVTETDQGRLALIQQQLDWLSHVDFGPIPKMIIVSMPNIKTSKKIKQKNAEASGEDTPLIIKVLKHELLPYIDQEFNTQPFRIIESYSTFANLPLGILALKPELFNAYISISPALVLDKSGLLEQLKTRLKADPLAYKNLYASLGDMAQNKPRFAELEQLLSAEKTQLSWTLADLSGVNYYTTATTVLPQALEKLFADRQPKDISQFMETGVKGVEDYFKQLQQKYGFEVSPISTLHDLGQMQLDHQQYRAALSTFQRITTLKPSSIYYLTLLAKAQHKNQQTDLASATLERALTLAKNGQYPSDIEYVKAQIALLN
ncbi:alpha/beta hydrolase-fold protein [Colwelliaceae bacterium 6471]